MALYGNSGGFWTKEIHLEKEAVEYLNTADNIGRLGSLSQKEVIKELKYYLLKEIVFKKEALLYLNAKMRRPKITVKREEYGFMKKLRSCVGAQIQLKVEGEEFPTDYTLAEVGKDYVVVAFGQSLRFVQKSKIIFFQVGSYVQA